MKKLTNIAVCLGLVVSLGIVSEALGDPNFPLCGAGNKGDSTKDGVGNMYTCDGSGHWLAVKAATVVAPTGTQHLNLMTGSIDYDFPAIGAVGDYAGCRDSFLFTVKNSVGSAAVGDPCFVGYKAPTPYDGGGIGSQNFEAHCEVVGPGTAIIRGCCMQGDGGSCDVVDAGYVCSCLQIF